MQRQALRVGRVSRSGLLRLFWLDQAFVVMLFLAEGGLHGLAAPGAKLTALGRICGLLATNLCLVQLLLMGRNPWLERVFGMDRLARWHRFVGQATFNLIVVHILTIVIGYAQLSRVNIVREAVDLVLHERDVLMALVAFVFFVAVAVTSLRNVRRGLRYETWHLVHLYVYLAIALAVPHQIFLGSDFAKSFLSQAYWILFYLAAVSSLIVFRVVKPLRSVLVHRMRVASVVEENQQVVSVYIEGNSLGRLQAEAGQFFIWRFLCRGQWWQAHPYSLSAAPRDDWLRISVKDLGRGSGDVLYLPVGTRVIAEGPYGAFTAAQRTQRHVLFIAGGVGITPIRALLESTQARPARPGEVTLIYRVSERDDALFLPEIRKIAERRGIAVHIVAGHRHEFPRRRQPLSAGHLHALVPQIAEHDVYVCGPEPLLQTTLRSLRRLGVAENQIHYESFAF